jgi:N6-L-threonylcarbamoyladenine synthase
LLVGLAAAKAFALGLKIPLVAFDHLEGHLYACQLAHPDLDVYPCVGLVVSGGHTHLYRCDGPLDARLLGGTTDDAAGEAFDKVASLLGLGFPGGPAVERAARMGNPKAFAFPRSFLNDERLEFSFSGLKTAVLYTLRKLESRRVHQDWPPELVADIAASFQQAVIDVLVAKCSQALCHTGLRRLCVGGGVTANTAFRAALDLMCKSLHADLYIPPVDLCTDNAALGAIGFAKLASGQIAPLDIDVQAGLVRPVGAP